MSKATSPNPGQEYSDQQNNDDVAVVCLSFSVLFAAGGARHPGIGDKPRR